MAGQGKPAGRVANFFGRIGDRIVPGNNWNPQTGTWTATPTQYLGGVGGIVGNAVVPGMGTLIRNGVHGATTGQGVFGFLQGGGTFQGNPVKPATFNHQFTPNTNINNPGQYGVGGTSLVSVDPATGLPFTLPGLNPPQRFDPGPSVNPTNSFLGGRAPAVGGIAGLTGIASQMGGARGARTSGGGYTGDAARSLFAALTSGPMQFQTYDTRPYQQ